MALPNYDKAIKFKDTKRGSIGSIYLTGGGFVDREFKGIGTNSQWGWQELTWLKTPSRDKTFAFTNIDNIDVGLIPRCEIEIPYTNIDDYMDLRKIVGRERYFQATFFDVDEGDWVTRTMYCSENSKQKLFTLKQSLIGAMNLTIKLVGTNTDTEEVISIQEDGVEEELYPVKMLNVSYNLNGGSFSGSDYDYDSIQKHYYSSQVTIAPAKNISAPSGLHFKYWATKNNNGEYNMCYGANQKTTLWNDLELYAVWEDTNGNIV